MTYKGALVYWGAANPISVPDNIFSDRGYTVPKFDPAAIHDSDGFYDTVNRDRFIIPPSLDGDWVKVHVSVRWEQMKGIWVQIFPSYYSAADGVEHWSAYAECDPNNQTTVLGTTTDHGSITMPKKVHAGDYFRPVLWQVSTALVPSPTAHGPNILALCGSMSIEVL